MSEQVNFERAVSDFTARPGDSPAITNMMRIAMEALSPTLRRWAGEWLFRHCNIRVVTDEIEGPSDATPPKAANIC